MPLKSLIRSLYRQVIKNDPLAKQPWEVIDKCPVCSGKDFSEHSRQWWRGIKIHLVRCEQCNLVLQSPRLSGEGLKYYYETDYRHDTNPDKQKVLFSRGMRRGAYIQEFFSDNGVDIKGRRVVEIGCGYGGILEKFRQSDCDVSGSDFEANAVTYASAQGLKVYHGGPEALSDYIGKADIVILSHVLEHNSNPIAFLISAAELLTQEGVIYIEVPGMDDPRVIQKNFTAHPDHLIYFDRNTLNMTCKAAGLSRMADNDIVQALYREEY